MKTITVHERKNWAQVTENNKQNTHNPGGFDSVSLSCQPTPLSVSPAMRILFAGCAKEEWRANLSYHLSRVCTVHSSSKEFSSLPRAIISRVLEGWLAIFGLDHHWTVRPSKKPDLYNTVRITFKNLYLVIYAYILSYVSFIHTNKFAFYLSSIQKERQNIPKHRQW